jgi:hypothetical protein
MLVEKIAYVNRRKAGEIYCIRDGIFGRFCYNEHKAERTISAAAKNRYRLGEPGRPAEK